MMTRWFLATGAAALLSIPVAAQDFSMSGTSPLDMNTVYSAGLTAQIGNLSLGDTARGGGRSTRGAAVRQATGAGPALGLAASPAAVAKAANLSYRPDAALQQRAEDGYVKRLAKRDPEASRQLAAQLAKHDFQKLYRGLIAGTGLRDNEAGDALAAYTVLGWLIANNVMEPPRGSPTAVRAQMSEQLAANPRLIDPARRGDLGEELKLLFVTLHAGWQSSMREGKAREYSDGVAAMFERQAGQDLRALRLTSAGFAAR